jgi:succinoglycan biosynthesis protein ExoL
MDDMIRIAFFGHDAGDAAVRRRVQGFLDDGLAVTGFMMRRGDGVTTDWENIDLGRTYDAALLQRIKAIINGARKAAAHRAKLAAADIIYARNLDMLATAFLARRMACLHTPVIYECLDVHRLLTREDFIGFIFRRIEGGLLRRSKRLVVSSPAFIRNHFERRHAGRFKAVLVENRLAAGADGGPRPGPRPPSTPQEPLRIGWFGVLRCRRSLGLLLTVARTFGDKVRIVMHGRPALSEILDFHEQIHGLDNVVYNGPYKAPEDLGRIYSGVDAVWAGDFMEAGYNSLWLLPNRLYEGGYHAAPAIAPAGTETARWSAELDAGFAVDEDLTENLPALVCRLIADRNLVATKRQRLLDLPAATFVQPRGVFRSMMESVLAESGSKRNAITQESPAAFRSALSPTPARARDD